METEREINGVLCRGDTSDHVSLVVVGSTTAPVYRVMQCAARPAYRTGKSGSQRGVTPSLLVLCESQVRAATTWG